MSNPAGHSDNPSAPAGSDGGKSPLIAGLILLLAALALNYFFIGWLLPILANLFASIEAELPLLLRIDAMATRDLRDYWYLAAIAVAAAWFLGWHKRLVARWLLNWMALALGAFAMVFVIASLLTALALSLTLLPNPRHVQENQATIRAMDVAFKIRAAEDKYRQLHPDAGFTCSLEQLRTAEPLPQISSSSILTGVEGAATYKVSLEGCSRAPVNSYIASIKADGHWLNPISFCVDQEGRLGVNSDRAGTSGCGVGVWKK